MQEKIILILGASSDLGTAFIQAEIETYDYIIAHYHSNAAPLLQLKDAYPDKLCLKQADFNKKLEVERLAEEILREGRIPGYLIHFPAAKCRLQRFDRIPYADFQANMRISVNSAVLLLQKLLPYMAKKRYGKIVFVLSIHTVARAQKYISDYIMAKTALLSLMESLTAEYREKGIRVNSISPDTIATKFISELPELAVENKVNSNAAKRLLEVSDIVPVIAYLLSEAGDSLFGQNIEITS